VISESVARKFFGGTDPIGQEIAGGGLPGTDAIATIVGVAKDVRYTSLRVDAPLMIYRPYVQEPGAQANTFLIRTSSTTQANVVSALREELHQAAPAVPAPSITSLEDRVAGLLVEERMLAWLSSTTALFGVILAAIGIYAAVAAGVARRRREIGIRIALGARSREVARMTVGEAFTAVALGLAIGVPIAIGAGLAARGSLSGILFDLSTTDPAILSTSAGVMLLIAALAAYMPARRASQIDPIAVIRND
jgi:predicted lysophospholipase L1 biosynthesis ABC-type transport system permease subunit